jgi:hypothetical protein
VSSLYGDMVTTNLSLLFHAWWLQSPYSWFLCAPTRSISCPQSHPLNDICNISQIFQHTKLFTAINAPRFICIKIRNIFTVTEVSSLYFDRTLVINNIPKSIIDANEQTNSVAFIPQANYTNWATATCWRNLLPTARYRGVASSARQIPYSR